MGDSAESRRVAVLNVVGLTPRFIGEHTPRILEFQKRHTVGTRVIEPMLPAVTSSVQATYLTGSPPGKHGIVANGWYDRERAEHLFWKQSDHLVQGKKIWEVARERKPDFTCARLFWWNNMFSSVDYSITPRPIYCADGNKFFDVTSHPLTIRDEVKRELGDFPFPQFWGPMSGIKSSQWIADSAKWIERQYQPDLNLVYLPHLDYNTQKLGPDHAEIANDLRLIDDVVGGLIDDLEKQGVSVVILSEYGITPVNRPIHLNRIFRREGWLEIKDELGRDTLELGASKAFAIADHQVAHVYLNDRTISSQVRSVLENTEGVESVLDRAAQSHEGIDHARSGDFVVIADSRSWFTYYFWEDDAKAPDYARTVDIHRKPGYDPVELFVDPNLSMPKLRIGWKLARRKLLGQRALMDVIPLDATLVKGSHGREPDDREDWPVLIGAGTERRNDPIASIEVCRQLLESLGFE